MNSVHCRIMALPAVSAGWALPARMSCTRLLGSAQDALQAVGVVQQEVHALVGGEAAGEAEREHGGVAQAADVRAQCSPGCRRSGPAARTWSRAMAMRLLRFCVPERPQLLVARPRGSDRPVRRSPSSQRSLPQTLVQRASASGRVPGGDVHAVGDVPHRAPRAAASAGRAAGRGARLTSPCRRLTPLTAPLPRMAR